jgi:hypothetical protein
MHVGRICEKFEVSDSASLHPGYETRKIVALVAWMQAEGRNPGKWIGDGKGKGDTTLFPVIHRSDFSTCLGLPEPFVHARRITSPGGSIARGTGKGMSSRCGPFPRS